MNRPRISRSVPFWVLTAASIATTAAGISLSLAKLSTMETTLTDGSATGVEVYAGQSWIVLGGALVGAGVLGLFLTLSTAAIATMISRTVPEGSGAGTDRTTDPRDGFGYDADLGYEPVEAATEDDSASESTTPERESTTQEPVTSR